MTEDHNHDLAPLYVVDALDRDEQAAFELHLAGCADCRHEVAELREVAAGLSTLVAVDPPPALRTAVLDRVAGTPQVAGAGAGTVVPLRADRGRGSRLPYLVAAAALVVAGAFGGWALHSHREATEASGRQQQILQVLGASDVRTATANGPAGSSGTIVLSDSADRALFVARGMPALGDGRVYQLWTITEAATSAGTFTSSGRTDLIDLPPAALSAQEVALTVEPSGGSEQPTTKPIMVLTVPPAA